MAVDQRPYILVLGSLNQDVIMRLSRVPAAGETLHGNDFMTGSGGKGANQAVAAGRLSADHVDVCMAGRVGDDAAGVTLKEGLENDGVNVKNVMTTPKISTGTAVILVEEETGQNRIMLAKGANGMFTKADVNELKSFIEHAAALVLQLEIPMGTVHEAARIASEANVPVVLNPAPACSLSPELLQLVDYLVPNETEAELLCGKSCGPSKAIDQLLGTGVKEAVIVTLGETGVMYKTREMSEAVVLPAKKVKALDTTAAGDCFIGALVSGLIESMSLHDAIEFGIAASAIAVTRHGAQSSIPLRSDVL